MKISFAKPVLPGTGTAVVAALAKGALTPSAAKLDAKTGGAIKRAIRASRFEGNKGQSLNIIAPAGTRLERIMVVGLGKAADVTDLVIVMFAVFLVGLVVCSEKIVRTSRHIDRLKRTAPDQPAAP